ncbi:MAG: AraC family ligand binding domain-containing protein [Treponema sp.]|nr:AraC family ligand binding domain-containing protein [Treponema sp.]
MKYLLIKNDVPLTHISSGKLQRKNNFIHDRRTLDTFVIVVCIDGILHITQENRSYSLKKNQYLILFKETEHFGHLASPGPLSYYWCHFKIPNDDYTVIQGGKIQFPEYSGENHSLNRGGGGGVLC